MNGLGMINGTIEDIEYVWKERYNHFNFQDISQDQRDGNGQSWWDKIGSNISQLPNSTFKQQLVDAFVDLIDGPKKPDTVQQRRQTLCNIVTNLRAARYCLSDIMGQLEGDTLQSTDCLFEFTQADKHLCRPFPNMYSDPAVVSMEKTTFGSSGATQEKIRKALESGAVGRVQTMKFSTEPIGHYIVKIQADTAQLLTFASVNGYKHTTAPELLLADLLRLVSKNTYSSKRYDTIHPTVWEWHTA